MKAKTRLRAFVLLVLAPLLFGVYFDSCQKLTLGISPTECDWRYTNCKNTRADNKGTVDPANTLLDAAAKLDSVSEVHGLAVLGFTNWDRLEICTPDLLGSKTCYFNPLDLGTPCSCKYNWGFLAAQLDANLAQKSARDGRAGYLQVAPIFTGDRTVPPYLVKTPFGRKKADGTWQAHPTMLAAWNALYSALDAQLKTYYKDAQISIAIGNEVNAYLTSPTTVDGSGATASADAWAGYTAFFNAARSLITDRLVGVSTTYYGFCGLGDPATTPGCDLSRVLTLNANATMIAFTYYPSGHYVAAKNLTKAGMNAEVEQAFSLMTLVGRELNKGVVIQEAGFPSVGIPARLHSRAGSSTPCSTPGPRTRTSSVRSISSRCTTSRKRSIARSCLAAASTARPTAVRCSTRSSPRASRTWRAAR